MFARERVSSTRSDGEKFVARYEKGAPWEGYSDQEVLDRYRQLASSLTLVEFEQSAQEAVARFSPQDRLLFGQYMRRQAEQQDLQIAELSRDSAHEFFRDARALARMLASLQRRQPALLEQVLGIEGDTMDSPLVKATLAGIVAAAARQDLEQAR